MEIAMVATISGTTMTVSRLIIHLSKHGTTLTKTQQSTTMRRVRWNTWDRPGRKKLRCFASSSRNINNINTMQQVVCLWTIPGLTLLKLRIRSTDNSSNLRQVVQLPRVFHQRFKRQHKLECQLRIKMPTTMESEWCLTPWLMLNCNINLSKTETKKDCYFASSRIVKIRIEQTLKPEQSCALFIPILREICL